MGAVVDPEGLWPQDAVVGGADDARLQPRLRAREGRSAVRLWVVGAAAALLLVLAIGLRVDRVQTTPYHPGGDAAASLSLGAQIADHGDYAANDRGVAGSLGPTAYLPPALPYLLGITDAIGSQSGAAALHTARIEQALVGTAIVALIGLLAFELAGPMVALAALAIAAVYPPLVSLSATLTPDNLLVAFELGAAWALLRARRARDPVRWLIASGILAALAALSHESGLLLAIPLAIGARGTRPVLGRRQVAGPGIVLVAMALALAPWMIRDAAELHRFVPISDRGGVALAGTYNPTSAASDHRWLPFTEVPSLARLTRQAPGLAEGALDQRLAGRAIDYIGAHPLAPVQVGERNLLRLLGLDGGGGGADLAGFWIVAVLAALGLLTAAGRRAPRWLWGVPVVMALSAALVDAPMPRAREPIDPFLIVLAACVVVTALEPPVRRAWQRFLNWRFVKRA